MSTSDMNTNSDFEPHHKDTEIAAPQLQNADFSTILLLQTPPPPPESVFIRCGDLIHNDLAPTEFLFGEKWFPRNVINALYGESGIGKSTFMANVFVNLVTGADYFNGEKNNAKYNSAIYIATEDTVNKFRERIKAIANGADREIMNKAFFVYDLDNLTENLIQHLTTNPADLIIFDTYGDILGKDQSNNSFVREFMQEVQLKILRKFDTTLMYLHHPKKRGEFEYPHKSNVTGAAAFEQKIRFGIEFRVDCQDDRKRHLCVVKDNYCGKHGKELSYEIVSGGENHTFTFTGERLPFADLIPPPKDYSSGSKGAHGNKKVTTNDNKELVRQGFANSKTGKQISTETGISEATVCRLAKEIKAETQDIPSETTD